MDKSFDAAEAEARISASWLKADAFAAGANKSRDETFSIMIPPPNVTGVLHMGHAFNNTLQDILIRWHRMRGFDTLWQPGRTTPASPRRWWLNGSWPRTGKPAAAIWGARRSLQRSGSGKQIRRHDHRTVQAHGASCDWSRNAFTMSGAPAPLQGEEGNFHDAVIKVFVDMYNKGLIYRGKRLVNWDPHFETAISDLEVENIESCRPHVALQIPAGGWRDL